MFSLESRPSEIGDILNNSFRLFASTFWRGFCLQGFYLAGLIFCFLVLFLPMRLFGDLNTLANTPPRIFWSSFPTAFLLTLFIGLSFFAAIYWLIGNAAQGQRGSIWQAMGIGFRRAFALFCAYFLCVLILAVIPLLLVFLGALLGNGLFITMVIIAYLLFYLIFFAASPYVTFIAPFIVNQGLGALSAMSASMDLVKGHYWRTLGVNLLGLLIFSGLLFAAYLLILLASFIGGLFVTAIGRLFIQHAIVDRIVAIVFSIILFFAGYVLIMLFLALASQWLTAFHYCMFHDLSMRKQSLPKSPNAAIAN